jgi:hypothetical protein
MVECAAFVWIQALLEQENSFADCMSAAQRGQKKAPRQL